MEKFFTLLCAILIIVGCAKTETENSQEPTPQPEPSISYKVGDLYEKGNVKGLVFRVNEDGNSGLIVSMTEPEQMKAWGTEFTATGCNIRSCGEQNTAIIYTLSDWQTKYPAFAWCKSLGDGWYIPAIDELRELLIVGSSNTFAHAIFNHKATPLASDNYYLSSTEYDEWFVCLVDAHSLIEKQNYKQYIYHVRAIRRF